MEIPLNYSINRVTSNNVSDRNYYIDGTTIYWERFGGDEGDSEVFSYDVVTGEKKMLTRNNMEDTLYGPGLWISSTIRSEYSDSLRSKLRIFPKLQKRYQKKTIREYRNREVYWNGQQITDDARFEKSACAGDTPSDGIVWLSKRMPLDSNSVPSMTEYFDVMWYNPQTGETNRLTKRRYNGKQSKIRFFSTENANTLVFDGDWAVWTSGQIVMNNVKTGEYQTLDTNSAARRIEVSDGYVKYEEPQRWDFDRRITEPLDGGLTPVDSGPIVIGDTQSNSAFISVLPTASENIGARVKVYDTATQTLMTMGEGAGLDYYSDSNAVLDGHYVAYERSFVYPRLGGVWLPFTDDYEPPVYDPNQLRLFDIETQEDILITDAGSFGGLCIDGYKLVFHMRDPAAGEGTDGDYEIFEYNILTEELRQVTDNDVNDMSPKISGNTIVWSSFSDDFERDIFCETNALSMFPHIPPTGVTNGPAATVVMVPEPASAMLLGLSGLMVIRRGRKH